MTEQTEREREQRKLEREWEKEEKRRAEQQRKLAAESAARRAALRRSAVNMGSGIRKGAESAAGKTAKAARAARARGRGLRPGIAAFISDAGAFINAILKTVWRALTSFAEKPLSVPVFILAAMLSYTAITYFCGYRLFGLAAHPPTYQFYVCDYSVGFCTRLFVGAMISLFTDNVTITLMSVIINAAVCLSLIGQAVIAGLLMRAALKNRSVPAAVIGLFFMTNPLVVAENMSAPGLLDVYLLVLFLVWLAFLKTPLIALITPLFCLVGMAIHYEFLFMYLPPMLTLLLYYAFYSPKKRVRVGRWLAFAGGGAVSAASLYYFVFLAKNYLKLTSDEFYQHMLSRFSLSNAEAETLTFIMGSPVYRDYFDYYIFGQYQGYDYFDHIGDFFVFLKNWTSDRFNAGMFRKDMLLFLPVFLIAAVIWWKCAAKEKGLRKLPYVCFIGQALALVPVLIFSTDIWRWVSAALLTQFFTFAVVYLDKNALIHQTTDRTTWRPAWRGACMAAAAAYAFYGLSLMK